MIARAPFGKEQTGGIRFRKSEAPTYLNVFLHLHGDLEILLITGGEADACADGEKIGLSAGDAFLALPNRIVSVASKGRISYTALAVDENRIPEFSDLFRDGVCLSPAVRGVGNDPKIRALFESLDSSLSEKKDGPFSETLCKGYLLTLLSKLFYKAETADAPAGDEKALRTVVSYCTQHFSEDLSLGVLEERLHLNRYYISHLFSGKLGMGFNDFINSLRIGEACERLTDTDASITEIGSAVGFNTLRTFNRAFIRQTAMSPSEYRKTGNSFHFRSQI